MAPASLRDISVPDRVTLENDGVQRLVRFQKQIRLYHALRSEPLQPQPLLQIVNALEHKRVVHACLLCIGEISQNIETIAHVGWVLVARISFCSDSPNEDALIAFLRSDLVAVPMLSELGVWGSCGATEEIRGFPCDVILKKWKGK